MTPQTILEETERMLALCDQLQETHGCFTQILYDSARKQAKRVAERISNNEQRSLAGLFVTVKDNVSVQEASSRAGSSILDGYVAQYDATVVSRLKQQDAIVVALTSMDEFGFGSWNTNVGKGFSVPKNPVDTQKVAGGSSGGAAVATALLGSRHIAVAESTGGSIESPAAMCGVIGFCPTYGLLSRHGLISYADSLDKIGLMAQKASDLRGPFAIMKGVDVRDQTSVSQELLPSQSPPYKIGVLSYDESLVDPKVHLLFQETIEKLKRAGNTVVSVQMPSTLRFGVAAYYVLAMSEASTNLAMYCGLRYGAQADPEDISFTDYFSAVRTEHFGKEAKRRILLGTFMRSEGYANKYYQKAARVRTLIREEYQGVFDDVDVLLSPTLPCQTPTLAEAKSMKSTEAYSTDLFTVGPNLAGIPHASIPMGTVHGMPVGALLSTQHFGDDSLLSFIEYLEELL